jgi:hypothetical protein
MPSVDFNPLTSTSSGLSYSPTWASAYSIEFDTQVWPEWYQAYGKGLGFFDFLTIAGNIVSLKSDTVTAFTDVALEKPVKLGAAISVSNAGATCNMTLDATEYNATTTECFLKVGESVFIDPAYTHAGVPTKWQVLTVGPYNAGNPQTGTIRPWDAGVHITVEVPTATYLMVGGYTTGQGGGQPGAKSSGTTSATFTTAITATSGALTGGINAKHTYRQLIDKSGEKVLFTKMQMETEFRHNASMDKEISLGALNGNTITNSIENSGTSAAKGTKGLIPHILTSGMSLPYTTEFSVDHFDSIKDYLRSQGVTDTEVNFLVGSGLLRNVENNVLGFVKEYSAGSDLTNGLGLVGAQVKRFLKNGITTNLVEISSFDNAQTYGVMDNYLRNWGVIIPNSLATVKSDNIAESLGQKVSIPNVSIGYLNNNTENRERMISAVAGMNGFGLPVVDQWDRVNFYVKSEYALVANLVNQMIMVRKTGTYSLT